MSQVPVRSEAACGRSPRRALRPLLLLGGFVALWWALMTGVAQAEDAPDRGSVLGQVVSQVTANPVTANPGKANPVQADPVKPVRGAVSTVTHEVHKAVEPVTKQVAAEVHHTPTVRTVTTTVSQTTHQVLDVTPAKPVADAVDAVVVKTVDEVVDGAVTGPVEKPQSSVLPENSPHLQPQEHVSGKSPENTSAASHTRYDAHVLEAAEMSMQVSPGTDPAQTAPRGGSPLDGPGVDLALTAPCASSSGSVSSSSPTPGAITESSCLTVPTAAFEVHPWRQARLPGGPAYPPTSSPD